MSVDKNLFLYDLAVVAIMKNEAPYVKEWLDYHLLAGVNHFFIYDNQDDDEQKKILQPYIDAGLVTYIPYPGRVQQVAAYNNALENYKFFGRYMAFIDADEFIFPKSKPTITEVLDDILSADSQAAGVGINWQCFGTNGEKKADYSRGVLERFTRRAPTDWGYVKPGEFSDGNWLIKTVNNPRKVQMEHIHGAIFFDGYYSVNENGKPVSAPFYIIPPNNIPPLAEKIVINHYRVKSWEEAETRRPNDWRNKIYDKNEVFDDGILKYRDARLKSFEIIQGGGILTHFSAENKIDFDKNFNSLIYNLSPTFAKNISPKIFEGKLETFLTCRALSAYLKENGLDETAGNLFEELALNAIYKTLFTNLSVADVKLLIAELPSLLQLKYPVVKNILEISLKLIEQIKIFYSGAYSGDDFYRSQIYSKFGYIERLLSAFDKNKKQ